MKSRTKATAFNLALMLAILPIAALADTGNLYVGVDAGRSEISDSFDQGGIDLRLDERATAFRFLGGYEFSDFFGLELAYTNFGDVDADLPVGTVSAEASGLDATLVGRVPLGEQLSLTARIGYLWWDADTSIQDLEDSDSGNDVLVGIGAEYNTTDQFSITGGFTKYALDDVDVDYIYLGIRLRFGSK